MKASRSRRPRRLSVETLENRSLLAAQVTAALTADGLLAIEGTQAADVISVEQVNGMVSVSGIRGAVPATRVRGIVIEALGGDDRIVLNSEVQAGRQPLRVTAVVDGGAGNDTIIGTTAKDLLYGGPGNDTIRGNSGDDEIFGGEGDDLLYGEDGNDTLRAEAGNDTIGGGAGNDGIIAGDGDDAVYGDLGNDTVFGGNGRDRIWGGAGDDHLSGEAAADVIYGELGRDTLTGGEGYDLLFGGDDDDRLIGNEGDDTLYGEAGNDYLHGGAGADTVYGGLGDDELHGGSGSDALYGQAGRDRFHDNYFSTREDYNFWRESWNGVTSDLFVAVAVGSALTVPRQVPAYAPLSPSQFAMPTTFVSPAEQWVQNVVTDSHASVSGGLFAFPAVDPNAPPRGLTELPSGDLTFARVLITGR